MVACIIVLSKELEAFGKDINLSWTDLEVGEVEVISIQKLCRLKKQQEEEIKNEGLVSFFESCQVERSNISGFNREEAKSDILI